jgi:hypothetical protein
MAFCITYRAYVTSPEANKDEGLCGEAARRSAAQPEAPSEAPMHIRAVMCWTRRLLVMVSTRDEHDFRLTNFVDKTMSKINTPGPETLELMS